MKTSHVLEIALGAFILLIAGWVGASIIMLDERRAD